jgi:hypothetical protein
MKGIWKPIPCCGWNDACRRNISTKGISWGGTNPLNPDGWSGANLFIWFIPCKYSINMEKSYSYVL